MITYEEYLTRTSFTKEELLANAHNRLLKNPPPEAGTLPSPPFLMFDRILEVERNSRSGRVVAEQDINLDAWFFQCHFRNDPVQPGCLGVDAVWQLTGLWLSLCGSPGTGRALGVKEVVFNGQIRPHNKVVRYELFNLKSIKTKFSTVGIGDANVYVDDKLIYEIKGQKVGMFLGIRYENYPWEGPNAQEK